MSLMARMSGGQTNKGHMASSSFQRLCSELKSHLNTVISPAQVASAASRSDNYARAMVRASLEQAIRVGAVRVGDLDDADMAIDMVIADIFGLGLLEGLLDDEEVSEIMVNGPENVFIEKQGRLHKTDKYFQDEIQLRNTIDRIIAPLGRRLDESSPMVSARTNYGHRVQAMIPPIALDGTSLTIRKFRTRVYSLAEMESLGSMSSAVRQLLFWAVRQRLNIAVAGGTGSGKTTLLNALSLEIPFGERIVTIEDSAELRFFSHPHVVRLEARPANLEGQGAITIRDLVIACLRMRPDRIVVGEVRGGEALEMLQAMNTGHSGSLTTLHANSAEEVVSRLVTMVGYISQLPYEQVLAQISSAFDLVIFQQRGANGLRRIISVAEMNKTAVGVGLICPVVQIQNSIKSDKEGNHNQGTYSLLHRPVFLESAVESGAVAEEEVELWANSFSTGQ